MAGDGTRDGQDISLRIRDELERIRDSEARVEEALEAVRQARRRVEVIARELGREEERVRAWVREELRTDPARSAPPAEPTPAPEAAAGGRAWRVEPETARAGGGEAAVPIPVPVPLPAERDPERRPAAPELERRAAPAASSAAAAEPAPRGLLADRRVRLGLVGLAATLLVILVGWIAIRGLRQGAPVTAAAPDGGIPVGAEAGPAGEPTPDQPAAAPVSVLAALPTDPAAREALYDSLWAARSPLFAPLLTVIREESDDRDVEDAADAWEEGEMDAEESDLLHSAFLQHVLNQRIDQRVDIDGQVLRNPCRGGSCSALLNLWQVQGAEYGLPPIPDDAPTNTQALRTVEAALVLDWMRELDAQAPGA